jgi:cytochrome c553
MINQILIAGGIAFVAGGAYLFHQADLYVSALTAALPPTLAAAASTAEAPPPQSAANFPQPAPPPPWAADLAHANPADGQTVFASCAGCHGAQGSPSPGAPFPRLAGLAAPYVAERLYAYRAGAGPAGNPMQGIAGTLSPHTIAALAAYIATLPVPPSKPANGPAAITYLDEFGDNARAIPACGACHGPSGAGVSPFIPALAGQTSSYIASRLNTWRDMSSPGPDDKVMAAIAKRLTPAEIRALGDFYQQQ